MMMDYLAGADSDEIAMRRGTTRRQLQRKPSARPRPARHATRAARSGAAAAKYREALESIGPGAHWDWIGKIAFWGVAVYCDRKAIIDQYGGEPDGELVENLFDRIAADVEEYDPITAKTRDGLRRGIVSAIVKQSRNAAEWMASSRVRMVHRPRPTAAHAFPNHVRDLVEAGGGEATFADLLGMSPYDFTNGRESGNPQLTMAAFFELFDPDAQLFIDASAAHQTGTPGVNIRTAAAWARYIRLAGAVDGDLVTPNPLTGTEGTTTDGRKSFIAQDCVSDWPFLVVEFDDVKWAFGGDVSAGLAWQCAFWRGLLTTSPLASAVAAIVFSGGKSLHGLLRVGAETLADWLRVREQLCQLLVADPTEVRKPDGRTCFPFRADRQAMEPLQKVRLPGARRNGTGELQRLLYMSNPVSW